MNRVLRSSFVALSLAVASAGAVFAADKAALVDFGKFSPSAAGEFVEVNVSGVLLKFAATCAEKQEPLIADMLRGLKHVRVNVIGLDETNRAANTERVTAIRKDLVEQGWTSIVTARGKKSEDVVIFAKVNSDETIDGLVITVIEGSKQAVLVNIVGQIKASQVAALAEHLNIPGLKIAASATENVR